VPLSTVQKALDEAREAHPTDVIVAHMKGLFVGDDEGTGLALPENTCVVLDGVIRSGSEGLDHRKSPKDRDTQLIMMAQKGFASFSGGIADQCLRVCLRRRRAIEGPRVSQAPTGPDSGSASRVFDYSRAKTQVDSSTPSRGRLKLILYVPD